MSRQTIQFGFDKDAVMNRVQGRHSVFLDSDCWVEMTWGKDETARRVRDRLKELVAASKVFCPLSWGVLEELLKQSGSRSGSGPP